MGALAKLCYNHIDNNILTHADLVSVLNRMPFTSDENESMTSHRILLDQIENPNSVIHHASVKPAAQQAVSRIRQHIAEHGSQPEERVLDQANIMRLEKLSF